MLSTLIPITVAAFFCFIVFAMWATSALRICYARKNIETRILVLGSRGKSGTVRLLHALMNQCGIPSYAKITGTIAQEIDTTNRILTTRRLGLVSSDEMGEAIIRASKRSAKAIVFECMAVSPKLIAFVQNRIIKAQTIIIPTIRLDHLEDEGQTISEITKNILLKLKNVDTLITGETNESSLKIMKRWARRNHVTFYQAQPTTSMFRCDGHHDTNVAIALQVGYLMNLEYEAICNALEACSTEPEASTGWELKSSGKRLRYTEIGGANDPESAAEAALKAKTFAFNETTIPVIVNRWDRPLRSVSFAAALTPSPNISKIGVIGSATLQTKKILKKAGFTKKQIVYLGWSKTYSHKRTLKSLFALLDDQKEGWIVMYENIHSPSSDRIRSTVHQAGIELKERAIVEYQIWGQGL